MAQITNDDLGTSNEQARVGRFAPSLVLAQLGDQMYDRKDDRIGPWGIPIDEPHAPRWRVALGAAVFFVTAVCVFVGLSVSPLGKEATELTAILFFVAAFATGELIVRLLLRVSLQREFRKFLR